MHTNNYIFVLTLLAPAPNHFIFLVERLVLPRLRSLLDSSSPSILMPDSPDTVFKELKCYVNFHDLE